MITEMQVFWAFVLACLVIAMIVVYVKLYDRYKAQQRRAVSIIREIRPEKEQAIKELLQDITLSERLNLIYLMHKGCKVIIDIDSEGEAYISAIAKDEVLGITTSDPPNYIG